MPHHQLWSCAAARFAKEYQDAKGLRYGLEPQSSIEFWRIREAVESKTWWPHILLERLLKELKYKYIYIYVYILSLPNVGRPLMDCQSYGVSIALPVRLATLVRSNFGAFHLVQSPGVTFNGLRFHHDHDGSGSRWLAHQGPVETGRNAELAAARSQCAWSGADHQLHSSLVSIFAEARPNAGWIGIGLDVSSSFGSLWLMVQYFRLLVEVGYNNVYIYI